MKKVFIDMDGVIVDFVGTVINSVYPDRKEYFKAACCNDPFSISTHYPGGKNAFDSYIESLGADWWENLKPLPWFLDLVGGLSVDGAKHGFQVAYLSSPHTYTKAAEGKIRWLKRFGINPVDLVLTQNKWLCASPSALLIDDYTQNIAQFKRHGGHVYFWQSQFLLAERVTNVADEIKAVRKLAIEFDVF